MGLIRRILGREVQDTYTPDGQLVIGECPGPEGKPEESHDLTERDVVKGEAGYCPRHPEVLLVPVPEGGEEV